MKYKSEEHKHAALATMYGVSGKSMDKLKGLFVPDVAIDEWLYMEKIMERIQEDKRLVDDAIQELCRDET